jgi:hypothetical protein
VYKKLKVIHTLNHLRLEKVVHHVLDSLARRRNHVDGILKILHNHPARNERKLFSKSNTLVSSASTDIDKERLRCIFWSFGFFFHRIGVEPSECPSRWTVINSVKYAAFCG